MFHLLSPWKSMLSGVRMVQTSAQIDSSVVWLSHAQRFRASNGLRLQITNQSFEEVRLDVINLLGDVAVGRINKF